MSRDRTIAFLLLAMAAGPVSADGCENAADAATAQTGCTEPVGAQAAAADPAAGYRKKTPYDNTPYRFNAQKGFTAAEFDAWMKARGIRIAGGKPAEAAPPEPVAPPVAQEAVLAAPPVAQEVGVAAQPVAGSGDAVPPAQESTAAVNCVAGQTTTQCVE